MSLLCLAICISFLAFVFLILAQLPAISLCSHGYTGQIYFCNFNFNFGCLWSQSHISYKIASTPTPDLGRGAAVLLFLWGSIQLYWMTFLFKFWFKKFCLKKKRFCSFTKPINLVFHFIVNFPIFISPTFSLRILDSTLRASCSSTEF